MGKKRGAWNSRFTFILAAVGSAVGLGNAWRFPGLVAKHGGGTFIFVYIIAMLVLGVPLLMMELAIGRRMRKGVAPAFGGMNKKFEFIGWAATANAFIIATYYAVVFGWVILMTIASFKFANLTGNVQAAKMLWSNLIKSTGNTTGFTNMSTNSLLCIILAWALIYWCIRNGAQSVSKVVKYTVFLPIVCLLIMAIKGFTMGNTGKAMYALFVPKFGEFTSELWIDAIGQVFYSLSVMMAIMVAYGSFLKDSTKIAQDAIIIAVSDMLISILSAVVLFTTTYGIGHTINDMSSSGINTAFFVFPQTMVMLSGSGVFNAIFASIFYFCLCTLAIDSAFSIVEGVSASIADRFNLNKKKTTISLCLISGALSVVYATGAGLAFLDITDGFSNQFNMVIIGVLEAIAVGWFFKTEKVLKEVNKNSEEKGFRMPKWWFYTTIKVIAPIVLSVFFTWNVVVLFKDKGGVWGKSDGYAVWANIIFGWLPTLFVFTSGIIAKLICKKKNIPEISATWENPGVVEMVEGEDAIVAESQVEVSIEN